MRVPASNSAAARAYRMQVIQTTNPHTPEPPSMDGVGNDSMSFIWQNVLLISAVFLVIFIYLVLIIRKRWKQNFLHVSEIEKEKQKKNRPSS